MYTAVKESVCIVILSLVSLVSSRANHMSVISASSTDSESLSLMIISSSLFSVVIDKRMHLYCMCYDNNQSSFRIKILD